jgi:hypothetical protein
MLLAKRRVVVSQQQIAEAAGVTDLIEMNGTRVDQLAQAVSALAPELQFWYKTHTRLSDLSAAVNEYQVPVGVEWQGLFDDDDEDTEDVDSGDSETGDNDYGHYSVIIYLDEISKQLIIADPYKDYISQDRVFTFKEFLSRWYDYNEIIDPKTGRAKLVQDYRMMFIITAKDEIFPESLGMQRG